MKLALSTFLLFVTNILLSQVNSFPFVESFEQVFTTGANVNFIPNWTGNVVASSNRIFAGSDARTGNTSLNIIPISSFSGEILISFDFTGVDNPKISFYAFSKQNGSASSTRPTILRFATSIDGGSNYLDDIQIGTDDSFPNDNSTNYTQYEYELPVLATGASDVIVKITATRGGGSGSAAELVMDDFTIEEQTLPLEISSTTASGANSVIVTFNQEVSQTTAEQASNYTITNGITVNSASRTAPNQVTLTTTTMPNNNYRLTVNNIQDAATNTPSGSLTSDFSFVIPLSIDSIVAIDKNTIEVDFNLDVEENSAETTTNYSLDNTMGIPQSVERDNGDLSKVRLTFAANLTNNTFHLTANNIADISSLAIASYLTGQFSYLPIEVSHITANSSTEIQITFNQAIEATSAITAGNYNVDYAVGIPISVSQNDGSPAIVTLTLPTAIVNNTYTLTINSLTNLSGNATTSGLQSSITYVTATNSRDIVINEIFADPIGANQPQPSVLPNATSDEFIELYNTTTKAIDISGFDLSGGTIGNHVLNPGAYVILAANSNVSDFQDFGDVVGVTSWNTLTNGGEKLVLSDVLSNQIDSLTYSLDWYKDADKSDGGWSLEQINPKLICSDQSNWSSSNNSSGGTPGVQNNIFDSTPDTRAPNLISVVVNSDQEIVVVFDELMDASTLSASIYDLDNGLSVSTVNPNTFSLRSVALTLTSPMVSGTTYNLTVNGAQDCAGNNLGQNTIAYFFDNQPPIFQQVVLKDSFTIDLVFDEDLEQSFAETTVNYTIASVGNPSTANLKVDDKSRVSLCFANGFVLGTPYTLTYQNLADTLGNMTSQNSFDFVFENQLDTIIVISSQLIELYFKESLHKTNAEKASNYQVSKGLGSPTIASLNADNDKLVHLIFDNDFPENNDLLISFEDLTDNHLSRIQVLNSLFTYDTDAPGVDSLVVIDQNSLQVYFDEVLDQTSAESVNNYSVNNEIGQPTTLTLQSNRKSVILHFNKEFEEEAEHTLTITAIADRSGNGISTNRNFGFIYDESPPRLDRLRLISPNLIALEFSEEPFKASAEDISNYTVNNGIGHPTSVRLTDKNPKVVELTFEDLGDNPANELTIHQLTDLFGNTGSTNLTVSFSSSTPMLGRLTVLSDTSLLLQFTKTLTRLTTENLENYEFNTSLEPKYIIQDPLDASRVTVVLKTAMAENEPYSISVKNLEDLSGRVIVPTDQSFFYDDMISSITTLNQTTLAVEFAVDLDQTASETSTNYSLDRGIANPLAAVRNNTHKNLVTLFFGQAMEESEVYTLSVANLLDNYGDIIPDSRNNYSYDIKAPMITSVKSTFHNEIQVFFDEPVNPSTAEVINHYSLNNHMIRPVSATISRNAPNVVILTFTNHLIDNMQYELLVDRVEDDKGNAISNESFDFIHTSPTAPQFRDIVINEVYFDTDSDAGIPPKEFVELYNRSSQNIELRGLLLTDRRDTATLTSGTIPSQEHLILSGRTAQSDFQAFGQTLGLSGFPSLSNLGETIYLLDWDYEIIDSLAYDVSYYHDESREDGGFTIELINPDKTCSDNSNWGASLAAQGGTPGARNSIFDNTPDISAPQISAFNIISNRQLSITFNEPIDKSTLLFDNFQLNNNHMVNNVTALNPFATELLLDITGSFESGIDLTLLINGISDCSGNLINTSASHFALGAEPGFQDLIITEIMATPSPSNGLPESEYVEIYNTSDRIISLNGLTFSDATRSATLGAFDLRPDEYVILCPSNMASQFSHLGQTLGVDNWPTLNKTSDQLTLHNASGLEVFRVQYKESWFHNDEKAEGGFSLEMIDTSYSCLEEVNWTGTENSSGGTPGRINSVADNNPDLTGPEVVRAIGIDLSTVLIEFNEKLDLNSLDISDFTSNNGLNFIALQIGENNRSVLLTTHIDLSENSVYTLSIDNLTDCSGNLISRSGNKTDLIIAAKADPSDVIINEILFNPRTAGVKFVEIYNKSDKYIDLKDWRISGSNNSRMISEEHLFMAPGSYQTITDDGTVLLDHYPNATISTFIELNTMPSLPSTQGMVFITDRIEVMIDSFAYDESYHSSLLNSVEGVSLERISFSRNSNEPDNWFSASSTENFATPGYANSQSLAHSSESGVLNIEPPTFAPDVPGGSSFTTIHYNFNIQGNTLNIQIIDANGKIIRQIVQNAIAGTKGFFTWDGTDNSGSKARVGYYMVLMEVISTDGQVSYHKGKVAIGTRF